MTPAPSWDVTGNHLRAARALLGLTQHELAARVRVSANTISRMELWGDKSVQSPPVTINSLMMSYRTAGIEFTPEGPRKVERAAA